MLCHRSPYRRWHPDVWDLPGGHVEEDEVPQQALVRELREELGIEVTPLAVPSAHLQGAGFRMDVWLIDDWSGEPVNKDVNEHDALAWVDLAQVRKMPLAHPRLLDLLEAALS